MEVNQRSGKRKEFCIAGIDPNLIITAKNGTILIEKNTIRNISNKISHITGKPLTESDAKKLIELMKSTKLEPFHGKTIEESVDIFAKLYLRKNVRNSSSIEELAHMEKGQDETFDDLDSHEYQKTEIFQTTPDEHQYKFTAHVDRRGNAIIDRDRVNGLRSNPDNLRQSINKEKYMALNVRTMEALGRFLNPENIDELWKRPRSWYFTHDNITLPHRAVHLDSRNKVPNHNVPNEIKWILNMSGHTGSLGNVRIQDTLHQIISMRINKFWIPVSNPLDDYYDKMNLYIKEFAQYITTTEFVGATESIPYTRGYHFEFSIQRIRGRLLLTPLIDTYTFSKPVAELNEITFKFRNPFRDIIIDPDRGIFTITPSPAVGLPTLFTTTIPHLLNTGDLIYVLEFNSVNMQINLQMTTSDGLIITRINDLQFTVNIDTFVLNPAVFNNIHVYFGSKRIFVELEFVSLEH